MSFCCAVCRYTQNIFTYTNTIQKNEQSIFSMLYFSISLCCPGFHSRITSPHLTSSRPHSYSICFVGSFSKPHEIVILSIREDILLDNSTTWNNSQFQIAYLSTGKQNFNVATMCTQLIYICHVCVCVVDFIMKPHQAENTSSDLHYTTI